MSFLYINSAERFALGVGRHPCIFSMFQDKSSKFELILVESRIHRLARHYRAAKVLPPNFK